MTLQKLLTEQATIYGVRLDDEQTDRIFLFIAELLKWNRKINLTAITDRREVVIKHIVDSLTVASLIPEGASVLDLGSGGGFPVIPLAIARPDIRALSVDAVEKKIFFQRQACRVVGLNNVEAVHLRGEELGKSYREYFDVALSRAFSDIRTFVEMAGPAVRPGGLLVAMKGVQGKEEAAAVATTLSGGFDLYQEKELTLPEKAGERVILAYIKANK